MIRFRSISAACLVLLAALVFPAGCGTPRDGEEAALRGEALSSLQRLAETPAFRYRLRLESMVGVSGQTVSGEERCEGSRTPAGFTLSLARSTPVGEEGSVLLETGGRRFRQEGETWKESEDAAWNPLYDPLSFTGVARHVQSAVLEGEEERGGVWCRRLLLRLDPSAAGDLLTAGTWSYFSHLRYELFLRLWAGDAASPPLSLQLEVLAYDPAENLLRYRMLATLEPYDLGAADISLPQP
ncbi:MAG: hypothetical protein QME88_07120 [Actinomycetota bacterium]|nr:hypothetical protein [Actinomycetota bacterium]